MKARPIVGRLLDNTGQPFPKPGTIYQCRSQLEHMQQIGSDSTVPFATGTTTDNYVHGTRVGLNRDGLVNSVVFPRSGNMTLGTISINLGIFLCDITNGNLAPLSMLSTSAWGNGTWSTEEVSNSWSSRHHRRIMLQEPVFVEAYAPIVVIWRYATTGITGSPGLAGALVHDPRSAIPIPGTTSGAFRGSFRSSAVKTFAATTPAAILTDIGSFPANYVGVESNSTSDHLSTVLLSLGYERV